MVMKIPNVDINLPHGRTVANRLISSLDASGVLELEHGPEIYDLLRAVSSVLSAFPEDPSDFVGATVAEASALLLRTVVIRLKESEVDDSQIGRHVRNLFECLGMGEEGARLAIEVGEDPASPLRPYSEN